MARKAVERSVCFKGQVVKLPTDAKASEEFVDRLLEQGITQGNSITLWLPKLKGKGEKRVNLTIQRISEAAQYICGFYKIPVPPTFAATA